MSSWVSLDDKNDSVELAAVASGGSGGRRPWAPFASPTKKQLQREAHLAYDITSPFGTSKAKVLQSMALGVEDGAITYSEASCVSGFPMMAGDLNSKMTFAVTPYPDDPDSVLVRVAVSIDEIALPFAISWIKGRIRKMMRKDFIKAATSYLDAMAAAEAEGSCLAGNTTPGSLWT